MRQFLYKTLGIRALLTLLIVAFVNLSANAAEVEVKCPPDLLYNKITKTITSGCTYRINGEIKKGDYAKFKSLLKQRRDSNIAWVELNSSGGDLSEALQIAELIQNAFLITTVSEDAIGKSPDGMPIIKSGTCASACFIIWVGGVSRVNSSLHYLSSSLSPFYLHRPYFSSDRYSSNDAKSLSNDTANLISATRQYLSRNVVPQRIIDEMMKRSSVDAYRLNRTEADEISGLAAWYGEWLLARCGTNLREAEYRIAERLVAAGDYKNFNTLFDKVTQDPQWLSYTQCNDKSALDARIKFLSELK